MPAAAVYDQKIAARRTTADLQTLAAPRQSIGHRTARYRQVRFEIFQPRQGCAAPAGQNVQQPPSQRRAVEHATVQQHRIRQRGTIRRRPFTQRPSRRVGVLRQKRRQMATDRRIGGVRQTKLHYRRSPAPGPLPGFDHGQKTIHQQRPHLVAAQFRRPRAADQPRTAAEHRDGRPLRRRVGQQAFLGATALLPQLRQFTRIQPPTTQSRLDRPRQGQVHVVATQHQMVTDANAGQFQTGRIILDLNQGQVGGAAAHVTDQQQPRVAQRRRYVALMAVQPVVAGGLWFFQQPELQQTGQPRGFHRQRPRRLVERCRHGQHQFLPLQRLAGKLVIPGSADVGKRAGAGGDWRDLGDFLRRTPGQDRRGAIHAGVGQPAFGAGHQPARRPRAALPRQFAHDDVGDLARIGERPGQLPIRRRQFAHRRVIARRREQRPGRHQARRDQLLDGEQMDGGAVEIGVGDNRMGRAEINADQIAGRAGSSDGSALPILFISEK